MYANTRGLHSKKICIQDMLDENKPDIFLLTETQLKSDMGIKFKGYCFFGKQRTSSTGGGVGILVIHWTCMVDRGHLGSSHKWENSRAYASSVAW